MINDVRLQDATFQELATAYSNTVLVAQQEVEDALVGYLRGTERVQRLDEAVEAAHRAVDLSIIQYREGATDYTSVLNTQQAKLREDDELVNEHGIVALSVVALYKALGGGWELREGQDFVPAETREQMQARTRWGGLLSQKAAGTGREQGRIGYAEACVVAVEVVVAQVVMRGRRIPWGRSRRVPARSLHRRRPSAAEAAIATPRPRRPR